MLDYCSCYWWHFSLISLDPLSPEGTRSSLLGAFNQDRLFHMFWTHQWADSSNILQLMWHAWKWKGVLYISESLLSRFGAFLWTNRNNKHDRSAPAFNQTLQQVSICKRHAIIRHKSDNGMNSILVISGSIRRLLCPSKTCKKKRKEKKEAKIKHEIRVVFFFFSFFLLVFVVLHIYKCQ